MKKMMTMFFILILATISLVQCNKPQKNDTKEPVKKEMKEAVKKEEKKVAKEEKKKEGMDKAEIEKLSSELEVSNRSILFDGEEKKEESK